MATREQNELLCRVGPGTSMGNVFRRFWQPVATSVQVATPDGDPLRVRLLGEDYVLFRDTEGKLGFLDELCMHRGASLALGRVEHGGIRCLFHGWKFSVDGAMMECPNHPDANFIKRHRANSYPVREGGGIVFAYVGPPEKQPPFPLYPFFDLPDENRFPMRVNINCNYLQNLEGGLDSSHTSMLHSDYVRPNWTSGKAFTAMDDAAPTLEVEDTNFGYHYAAIRRADVEEKGLIDNVRVMPFIMPSTRIIPGRRRISIGGQKDGHADIFVFEVPTDDENTSTYIIIFSKQPVNRKAALERLGLDDPAFWSEGNPDYKPTMQNRFGQNRATMDRSWTGLRGGIYIEDAAMIGSAGKIYDRTKEHLVPADRAVVRARQKLIESAQRVDRGEDPVGLDVNFSKLAAFDGDLPGNIHWRELVPGHTPVESN